MHPADSQRSDALLRAILDTVTDGILTIDAAGRILTFNPACERIFGYQPEEVKGEPVSMLMPSPFRESHHLYVQRYLETGEARVIGTGREVLGLRKSGQVFPLGLEIGEMQVERGRFFVGVVRDLTAKKNAEGEVRKLEQQLYESQKLDTIGTLAGGIAHDFNNLLMSMLANINLASGAASQLAGQNGADDELRQCLEDARKAAECAADLTQQLLAYAGRATLVHEQVGINELVSGMADLMRSVITKRATLSLDLAEGLPLIGCDPTQVRQIVMNLITNASDALGGQDGSIRVRTSLRELDIPSLAGTIIGQGLAAGSYVSVEVTDTGCGMTHRVASRVFDPFFSTKFAGRGLGLAVVLGILRSHRGTISLRTEVGKGTTFELLLPAKQHERAPFVRTDRPTEARAESHAVDRSSITILLADDEPAVLKATERLLRRAGFRVVTATDGAEAVEKFAEAPDTYALLMVDWTMPRMDGAEVVHAVRSIRPDVRIVLASGYARDDVVSRLGSSTIDGFVKKPCPPAELVSTIERALQPG